METRPVLGGSQEFVGGGGGGGAFSQGVVFWKDGYPLVFTMTPAHAELCTEDCPPSFS